MNAPTAAVPGREPDDAPFHAGELAVQQRAGVTEAADAAGRRGIRRFMPEQHRTFFGQLPFFVLGGVDARGQPWATLRVGMPGFVTTPDARTLRIIPWDKDSIKAIEKAITEADLGVGTAVDDQGVRVTFPELTGERRTLLTKLANEKHEQAKVTLRGHRTDAIKELDELEKGGGIGKDDVKRLKDEVQKLIDAGNAALDAAAKKKAEEIAS